MAITRVRWKRGTAADWTSANPILRLAEPGWETDTQTFKVGDGVTAWSDLDYVNTGGGGGGGFDSTVLAAAVHAATGKTSLADADEYLLIDSAASNGLKKMLGSTMKTIIQGQMGLAIHGATVKATPVDADELGLSDSAASFGPKRFTWANVKAALKAQIPVNTFAAATGDMAMGTHKITGLDQGVNPADAVTVDQMQEELDFKLNVSDLLDFFLDLMTGVPRMISYNTATSSWPTLDTGQALDSRISWIFLYSDEGDPPPGAPDVAGLRLWARIVAP